MRQFKMPIVMTDRSGRIRYCSAAAKRCGAVTGDAITVRSADAAGYEALWSGKSEICVMVVGIGGDTSHALVGLREYGGERMAVWVYPTFLQISELNILSPSLTGVCLRTGPEIIDFVLSVMREEESDPRNARTPSSVRRMERIHGHISQIAAKMAQRGPELLDAENLRYRIRRILSLLRLQADEVFPRSGYTVTLDDPAEKRIPDAPVPFWPLALVMTAMLLFVLEISDGRCARVTYEMDELDFIFEVHAAVRTTLPRSTASHAFAQLGLRYPDLYPDLLFAVRLSEAMGWTAVYHNTPGAEENFRLSLAVTLPDPFAAFLGMPRFEPDYDAEFSDFIRMLLSGISAE